MEKILRNLYKRFLNFDRNYYFQNVKSWFGIKEFKLERKILNQFYENYQKKSFIVFLRNIKIIIYSRNAYEFILKKSTDDWDLWLYLKFLEYEKIIKVQKNGKVFILKKEILKIIPKPKTEKEIKEILEKKLESEIEEKNPVIDLFKKYFSFEVKAKWDQMPISQGSAIFVAKKILEKIPLNKKFLFVGDDDFISVILGLAEPKMQSLVIDADEQLLENINFLANEFNLKIETRKIDIQKDKNLGEKFIGFLVNPVYTEDGVKEFVKYGINQLGKDGGLVFLEIGDESIGNRFLFLQEFFAKINLIIEEIIPNKIYYPWISLHKEEEKIINKRMFSMIDEKIVKNSPKLGSLLYIFEYLPFRVKKIKLKKSIYNYL